MKISKQKIEELLLTPGYITAEELKQAEEFADLNGEDLGTILVERGIIRDEQLGKLFAEDQGYQFINLRNIELDDTVFSLIPEGIARSRKVIAFGKDQKGIKVAMSDPKNLEIVNLLKKLLGKEIFPYYATDYDITNALSHYKLNLASEFKKVLDKLADETLTKSQKDQLVVETVDMLLQYGFHNKASDIHVEPHDDYLLVRFRIDGVVHDVLKTPIEFASPIITRIKILSKMRTDEHQAAQDGKFRFKVVDENVDVRVSVVPVNKGENIVMRLLAGSIRDFSINKLGLSNNDIDKVYRVIKNPHGMILVSGPTGSGKTTSIYALLKILNTRDVHINSIEDPVEYDIDGISQIQVNPNTNLTFAEGLRAIVRQDPDIIFVGEIRDQETADVAVNAAMTGHLVLSTLHANDSATTLIRFLDMGIEAFLVSSTVNVVMAQRLLRKICLNCRMSYETSAAEEGVTDADPQLMEFFKKRAGKDGKLRLYKGAGCEACGNTSYKGRTGIFEVMEVDDEIRKLVIKRESSSEIKSLAVKKGMRTLLQDGFEKVSQGLTTFEEVLRVIGERHVGN